MNRPRRGRPDLEAESVDITADEIKIRRDPELFCKMIMKEVSR